MTLLFKNQGSAHVGGCNVDVLSLSIQKNDCCFLKILLENLRPLLRDHSGYESLNEALFPMGLALVGGGPLRFP